MFADPQVEALRDSRPDAAPHARAGRGRQPGGDLSRTPCVLDRPTPGLGEHTEEVLGEIGYTANDIAGFRRGKTV